MSKPIVAIVGRPNVGKSALFNRLVGRRQAIVEDLPGTTRDRLYADSSWGGREFAVVDTGGVEPQGTVERGKRHRRAGASPLAVGSVDYVSEIRAQVEIALAEADVILMLVDAQTGLTSTDHQVAEMLRGIGKPIVLAVNKADNLALRNEAVEFYELGLGDPIAISALHGTGTGDLLDELIRLLPEDEADDEVEGVQVALVGRPNVGKSSLLNAILGQDRSIVSPIPGTTRDAIDTRLDWSGTSVVLIDTAGIRRRGKIERGIERYSVIRAMKTIHRADVVLLLVDATTGVRPQDAHIAGYVLDERKSVVVVVNKWDLLEKDTHTMDRVTREIRAALRFLDYVPVLFISALTRQRVSRVIPMALQVAAERTVRIPTSALNRLLRRAVDQHAPPSRAGSRLRLYYATQADVEPPTFVFFVNDAEAVHFSYSRYLENRIREHYAFLGTPIELVFRARAASQRG